MGIMITYHGYNNGCNNPMFNVHKNVGAHYTWRNMVAFQMSKQAAEYLGLGFSKEDQGGHR